MVQSWIIKVLIINSNSNANTENSIIIYLEVIEVLNLTTKKIYLKNINKWQLDDGKH